MPGPQSRGKGQGVKEDEMVGEGREGDSVVIVREVYPWVERCSECRVAERYQYGLNTFTGSSCPPPILRFSSLLLHPPPPSHPPGPPPPPNRLLPASASSFLSCTSSCFCLSYYSFSFSAISLSFSSTSSLSLLAVPASSYSLYTSSLLVSFSCFSS